jgi:hypothetical protein
MADALWRQQGYERGDGRESGMSDRNNRSGVLVPPRHPEWEVWGEPMFGRRRRKA